MSTPADQVQSGFPQAGLQQAVQDGIDRGDGSGIPQEEQAEVKKILEEYTGARDFDKYARQQYNKDRRYAQGVADLKWASDANIIGSFIEILCSFLYAKNPDVSVRPAPRAGGQPDKDMTRFSETLQIVISRLWKDAKMKRQMRRVVRSVLSVGPGWVKLLMYTDNRRNPQLEKQLGDARDNLAKVKLLQEQLGDLDDSHEERQEKMTELQNQITGLQAKVERLVKRGLCADFVRAEDMQVSLDVADTADHCEADWNSNDLYIRKADLQARFIDEETGTSRITDEDLKKVTIYHQRQTGPSDKNNANPVGDQSVTEGQFFKSTDNAGMGPVIAGGEGKAVEFVKVVELWDRRDSLIKTFVDGLHKWAVPPYAPPQATTRFYPYFRLAFFDTDGARHPQSLSWRLFKLQDEYSAARSNFRLVRERSIPGTIFNKGQLDPDDVKKLEESTHMEMVGISPTTNDLPLEKVIAQKNIPRVDPALYETSPIMRDMQIVSGVQEAQAQQTTGPQTATEAEIQNSGFASRTGADREMLEDLLTEMAQYVAETSVQSLTVQDVQRYAGMLAFWPGEDRMLQLPGMDSEDVLTMVDVDIKAGSTGKPGANADKETWATLLPLITNFMAQIQALEVANPPLALGYRNLMRETLKRLDDRLDIDSIIPPAMALPGAVPGMPLAGGPAGGPAGAAAPPVGNGTVNNPLPPTV